MATLTLQLFLQQHGQLVDQVEIARIGERDVQMPVLRMDGHEVVAEHQVDGDGMEQIVIDADFAQIDELAAVALGQRLCACAISSAGLTSLSASLAAMEIPLVSIIVDVSAREKIGKYSATNTKVTKRAHARS